MLSFDYGQRATQGAREYQEDAAALLVPATGRRVGAAAARSEQRTSAMAEAGGHEPESASDAPAPAAVVAVLADGMGGHTGGALASRTICDTFLDAYQEVDGTVEERLRYSLQSSNDAIAAKIEADPVLSGMGSTIVGVAFDEDSVQWISVGDSPLFLFRRGEVAILNEDHSLAPELDRLAREGQISFEQARQDPRRHMLRSAVTGEDLDLVDQSIKPLALEDGDYVLLASDGLNTLQIDEIARIVAAYADDGAEAVASALIRSVEAWRDPHQDNTTVIAVRAMAADTGPASASA